MAPTFRSSQGEIEIASDERPRRQKRDEEDRTDLKSTDNGEGKQKQPSRQRQSDRGRDSNKEHAQLVTALCALFAILFSEMQANACPLDVLHHPSIILQHLQNYDTEKGEYNTATQCKHTTGTDYDLPLVVVNH